MSYSRALKGFVILTVLTLIYGPLFLCQRNLAEVNEGHLENVQEKITHKDVQNRSVKYVSNDYVHAFKLQGVITRIVEYTM